MKGGELMAHIEIDLYRFVEQFPFEIFWNL